MADAQQLALVQAALDARKQAYAKYSDFQVGAALQMASGRIIVGANVENASYGLAMCAERVAIQTAVVHGERDFEAIAVASRGGVAPCGACRQVLAEFCADLTIWLVDANDPTSIRKTTLEALLPERFSGLG